MASSPLTIDTIRRLKAGSTLLLWAFIVVLVGTVYGSILGTQDAYGYRVGFNWLSIVWPILGIIGMAKIRGAFQEVEVRLMEKEPRQARVGKELNVEAMEETIVVAPAVARIQKEEVSAPKIQERVAVSQKPEPSMLQNV